MKPFKTLLKHPSKGERSFDRYMLIVGDLGSTLVGNLYVSVSFVLFKNDKKIPGFSRKKKANCRAFCFGIFINL
jgi:hypothetical protein